MLSYKYMAAVSPRSSFDNNSFEAQSWNNHDQTLTDADTDRSFFWPKPKTGATLPGSISRRNFSPDFFKTRNNFCLGMKMTLLYLGSCAGSVVISGLELQTYVYVPVFYGRLQFLWDYERCRWGLANPFLEDQWTITSPVGAEDLSSCSTKIVDRY